MKRLLITAPRTVVIDDAPIPRPGPGQILLRERRSAISTGTELSYYRGAPELRLARSEYTYPITPGYAAVGLVEACGEGVDRLEVGDRVVCLAPHAEFALADAKLACRLPPGLDDDSATGAVLAVTTMHSVRRAEISYAATVVVIGAGVVGILAGLQARLAGASRVFMVDTDPWRLERARGLGLNALGGATAEVQASLLAATAGLGADVVIEAAGAPDAFADALHYARDGGRIVTLGYHTRPVTFVPGEEYYFKELDLRASRAIGPDPGSPVTLTRWTSDRSLAAAVDLLASRRLPFASLVTHRVPFAEAPAAYDMLDRKTEPALHVVFEWSQ